MNGRGAWYALAAVLGAVVLASAQQIIGGHALDANLRVGSEGINTRSPRADAPGLSRPIYNPAITSPVASRRSAAGIQQPLYWTTTQSAPVSGGPRWTRPSPGGATYATAAGTV